MAKRFTSTEIWKEDWFLDMPNQYKLFWYYMLAHCDHSGLFKVNLRSFCGQLEVKMTSKEAFEYFNNGKQRIRSITDTLWLIEEFYYYQYGEVLNPKNRVHQSVADLYKKYGIELTSIRGLKEVKQGVKDKDKDKDKEEDIDGKYWFLKFFHSDYKNYVNVFNGQSTTKEMFTEWKVFVNFIYEKEFTEIFDCKFISPHDYAKLVEKSNFTKDKWELVIKAILSTGIKPEHNLFFRIPQFMKYASDNATPEIVTSVRKEKTQAEKDSEMEEWLKDD